MRRNKDGEAERKSQLCLHKYFESIHELDTRCATCRSEARKTLKVKYGGNILRTKTQQCSR